MPTVIGIRWVCPLHDRNFPRSKFGTRKFPVIVVLAISTEIVCIFLPSVGEDENIGRKGWTASGALMCHDGRLYAIGFFLTGTPYDSLTTTTSFDDGGELSATKRAGRSSLSVERGHRSSEPRKEDLEHHFRQSRFRLGQRFTDYDRRTFPSCPTAMNFWLTSGQDSISSCPDYVEIGLNCADICTALERGTNGKKLDDLSRSVCEAINQLMTWVNSAA